MRRVDGAVDEDAERLVVSLKRGVCAKAERVRAAAQQQMLRHQLDDVAPDIDSSRAEAVIPTPVHQLGGFVQETAHPAAEAVDRGCRRDQRGDHTDQRPLAPALVIRHQRGGENDRARDAQDAACHKRAQQDDQTERQRDQQKIAFLAPLHAQDRRPECRDRKAQNCREDVRIADRAEKLAGVLRIRAVVIHALRVKVKRVQPRKLEQAEHAVDADRGGVQPQHPALRLPVGGHEEETETIQGDRGQSLASSAAPQRGLTKFRKQRREHRGEEVKQDELLRQTERFAQHRRRGQPCSADDRQFQMKEQHCRDVHAGDQEVYAPLLRRDRLIAAAPRIEKVDTQQDGEICSRQHREALRHLACFLPHGASSDTPIL